MEAIRHGADAVYIGAAQFGARSAAGNSLEDISELTAFAHLYHAKVYVALNTLLTDEELPRAVELAMQLARQQVDALIVQDMGLVYRLMQAYGTKKPATFPIPLHASTQMNNRTPEKVRFLSQCGLEQVVLARELSLEEIRHIHEECPETRLEVFVHGALCVSYSGQCYASQYLHGRSANKGCCAQICRLSFDLCDSQGQVLKKNAPLLSLKDLNQSNRLEELLAAGASSFKIEGRLKDISYVKNTTAYYRKCLDTILSAHPELYRRASSGTVKWQFLPNVRKSFNRGFTHYFLDRETKDRGTSATSLPSLSLSAMPASIGEYIGTVQSVYREYLRIRYENPENCFHNGDGAILIDQNHRTCGFGVNRAEGNRLYLNLQESYGKNFSDFIGAKIYRNRDLEFEKQLARPSAERRIALSIRFREIPHGFVLELKDEDGIQVTLSFPDAKEIARTTQSDTLRQALGKLGDTPFFCKEIAIDMANGCPYFLPAARLNEWRRTAVQELLRIRRINYRVPTLPVQQKLPQYPAKELTYRHNIANREAEAFYRACGVLSTAPAYEQRPPQDAILMHTRYCIRRELGICLRTPQGKQLPCTPPLYLKHGRDLFPLHFDCARCEMHVLSPETHRP